jgi:hypothetical protein
MSRRRWVLLPPGSPLEPAAGRLQQAVAPVWAMQHGHQLLSVCQLGLHAHQPILPARCWLVCTTGWHRWASHVGCRPHVLCGARATGYLSAPWMPGAQARALTVPVAPPCRSCGMPSRSSTSFWPPGCTATLCRSQQRCRLCLQGQASRRRRRRWAAAEQGWGGWLGPAHPDRCAAYTLAHPDILLLRWPTSPCHAQLSSPA